MYRASLSNRIKREKTNAPENAKTKKTTGKTRSSTIGDMRTHHPRETSSNSTNKPAHEQQRVKYKNIYFVKMTRGIEVEE